MGIWGYNTAYEAKLFKGITVVLNFEANSAIRLGVLSTSCAATTSCAACDSSVAAPSGERIKYYHHVVVLKVNMSLVEQFCLNYV